VQTTEHNVQDFIVWIHEDLTLIQRKQLFSLRSKLKCLPDSGEHGWVIRCSNGSPKFVENNPRQSMLTNGKN